MKVRLTGDRDRRGGRLFGVTAVVLCGCLALAACGTPVKVSRVSPEEVNRELTGYALSGGEPSGATGIVMARHTLLDEYRRAPAAALARLHQIYLSPQGSRREAFALAELSFLHAQKTGNRSYFLASALYAYAFLFPEDEADVPSAFDPRVRQATDLYNRALADGFDSGDGNHVALRAGRYDLPFGVLDVAFAEEQLLWHERRLSQFIPAAELRVEGLRNRYRIPGIGAPLVASQTPVGSPQGLSIASQLKVPATIVLRADGLRRQFSQETIRATLELHVALEKLSIRIGDRVVPLEIESTAALADTLAEPAVWEREFKGFFMGDPATRAANARLGALEPYRSGRMPVVFVHGTASSSGRWADMVNDLLSDARIRGRFQFWFFTYNTGNPIMYSGMQFRDELERATAMVDPERRDPALKQMVVIGHSQGGLLAKLAVVETGDRLWNQFSSKPLERMDITEEEKALFRQAFIVHPVPSIRRVVFIATPHRGSFQATTWVGRMLAGLVKLPGTLVKTMSDLVTSEKEALKVDPNRYTVGSFGSGFGMRPDNPIMGELADIPVAAGVTVNSIIAVEGSGPIEEGDDGIVEYASAHLDGVESEKVVRSGHSTQSHPETIEEVRRILLLHTTEQCGRTIRCE